MQFYEQNTPNVNLITAIDDSGVYIKSQCVNYPALISAEHLQPWSLKNPVSIDSEDLTTAIEMCPMTIILGSNVPDLMHWVSPHIHAMIVQHGIGFEVMQLQSACHTYNLLINEGRSAVLGLVFTSSP